MWLYLIAAVLLVVGIIGGILTGGIFLIIFIPLGLIALATAVVTGALARGAEQRAEGPEAGSEPVDQALPHSRPESTGRVPSSPEALVDARRQQQ